MPNPLQLNDSEDLTNKEIDKVLIKETEKMPVVKVNGKEKHFPYTKKGKKDAAEAKKDAKEDSKEKNIHLMGNPLKKRVKKYSQE